jgi:hypothetical protein
VEPNAGVFGYVLGYRGRKGLPRRVISAPIKTLRRTLLVAAIPSTSPNRCKPSRGEKKRGFLAGSAPGRVDTLSGQT